jgi:hypothetical protein
VAVQVVKCSGPVRSAAPVAPEGDDWTWTPWRRAGAAVIYRRAEGSGFCYSLEPHGFGRCMLKSVLQGFLEKQLTEV